MFEHYTIQTPVSSIIEHNLGICDTCGQALFFDEEIIRNIEYKDTTFKLQYCCYECKENAIKKSPFLKNLTFENHKLYKSIEIDNIKNMFVFILNHPWSIFYKAYEMIEYVEKLKNKEKLSWRERGFMANFNKYIKQS